MSHTPSPEQPHGQGVPRRRRRRSPPQQVPRDYLTRHQLLGLVPLGMSTIDLLERRDQFPSRFRIEPTRRVAWKRREVEKFMEERAKRRVHGSAAPAQPNTSGN
jgi:predicted DNA-binding transcriptional regulator AlpA